MVPIFNDGIWNLEALIDSDFANDKDTRYSVYGYMIYFVVFQSCGRVNALTEFHQPIQVQSRLEMPGILVQLGCIQRT